MIDLKYLQYRENDWNPEDIEERVLYKWVWKDDPLDDELYADERKWIKDIFKSEVTYYTEDRDRYPKFAPKHLNIQSRREYLQVGDTTQLDSFLARFVK